MKACRYSSTCFSPVGTARAGGAPIASAMPSAATLRISQPIPDIGPPLPDRRAYHKYTRRLRRAVIAITTTTRAGDAVRLPPAPSLSMEDQDEIHIARRARLGLVAEAEEAHDHGARQAQAARH